MEVQTASPTLWVPNAITKILNSQWMKWQESSVTICLNAAPPQTQVIINLYDYETKTAVDGIKFKVRTIYSEKDPINPGAFYDRVWIKDGPAVFVVQKSTGWKIQMHVEECSSNFNYKIFCVGISVLSEKENIVFSPPFFIATKCRGATAPTPLSISMEEIEKLRTGPQQRAKKRKTMSSSELTTDSEDDAKNAKSDSESESESDDDDDDDDINRAMMKSMLQNLENAVTKKVQKMLQTSIASLIERFETLLTNNRESTLSTLDVSEFVFEQPVSRNSSQDSQESLTPIFE